MGQATPTIFPELNAVLSDFAGRLAELFGDGLVGLYLQGSFALGGSDGFSDVDFLAVLDQDVTAEQFPLLQTVHEELHALPSAWARHLEGSYVPLDALGKFPPPKRAFWYLDNGAKNVVRSDHDDTLVVYWTLREKGIPLLGPAPAHFVPPVPIDRMLDEILATMLDWQGHFVANPNGLNNRFYQPLVVVSYCRMLHSLATGAIHSKPASAAWALEHLDTRWRGLIDNVSRARTGDAADRVREPADPSDLAATWLFMEYAIELGRRWAVTRML